MIMRNVGRLFFSMGHGSLGIRLSVKHSLILAEHCGVSLHMMVTIEHVVLRIQLHVNRTRGITYTATVHVNRTCGITYTATCKYNMWYYLYSYM